MEPASGKVEWNILAMARDGLRFELSSAFQKAGWSQEAVSVKETKGDKNNYFELFMIKVV